MPSIGSVSNGTATGGSKKPEGSDGYPDKWRREKQKEGESELPRLLYMDLGKDGHLTGCSQHFQGEMRCSVQLGSASFYCLPWASNSPGGVSSRVHTQSG